MQFKSILAITFLAAAQAVYSSPPPCLLAAVNTQPNPADYKTMCGQKASDVQKQIQSACKGDDTSAALSSFADTCKSNGVTVSSVAASSLSPASVSGAKTPLTTTGASDSGTESGKPAIISSAYFNTSCSCTLTTSITGTSKGSASATATGSGSSATGTTAGGSTTAKVSGSGSTTGAATAAGAAKPSTTGASGAAGQAVGSVAGLVVAAAGVVYLL